MDAGGPDVSNRVAIVGAGPAGSLLASALAQRGFEVDVYDQRSDPRQQVAGAGRSINLGLSKRGMKALQAIGLLDKVLDQAVVMRGRTVHAPDGSTRFQPYGIRAAEVLHSVDRMELNRMLLDFAESHDSVRLHFNHRLVRVEKPARQLVFQVDGQDFVVNPAWVVAADGAFSTMRRELHRGERAEYHQEFLEWGYKELTLAPGRGDDARMELTSLHLWPRGHCMIVSHPNLNGSHTLTLFLPFEGEDSFATCQTAADIERLFQKYFRDLVPFLPELVDEWMANGVGSLITTRTAPWTFKDWAVLVGDACHAVYPFYGQGMNSAFEDCSTLLDALDKCHGDRAAGFRAYESARRPHTDVLSKLSKANFNELRLKLRSPLFHARRRLDRIIERLFPQFWLPLYTMIAHTTIPYAKAEARSRWQDRILVTGSAALTVAAICGGLFWRDISSGEFFTR